MKTMESIPWVKQLETKLTATEQAKDEINRFCTKFSLSPNDLTMYRLTEKPYVRISAIVFLTLLGRKLKIINRLYPHERIEQSFYYDIPDFSELAWQIAEFLAEIFNGSVHISYDYNIKRAYLDVISGDDTIRVASVAFREKR